MNMYKFGNYVCKLREEKNMTQADLAKILNVTDKSISKWENGQAFPRIETFEKLADALETTVEDIISASKDGIERICVVNNFCPVMNIEIDGKPFAISKDEGKWIEFSSEELSVKITGEIFAEEWNEPKEEKKSFFDSWKEKRKLKREKKAVDNLKSLILQVDCFYKISSVSPESVLVVENDSFDVGDATLMYVNFQISYPKILCPTAEVKLVDVKGKNKKEVIKRYKKLGLLSDLGLTFFDMILFYPLRGLYFKHLCKNRVLKKNINKAEEYKAKTKKRERKNKKFGCIFGIIALIIYFVLELTVFPTLFVEDEKPYLLSKDYSSITFNETDVYIRIEKLPENAKATTFFGATVFEDVRTEGLSKWEQFNQDVKVQLFEDDEGRLYLWLIENYSTQPSDLEYGDFETNYVYVFEGN